MESANLRQKLHQYVDKGDEKLLKLMYAVAREYNEEDDFEYQFSDEGIGGAEKALEIAKAEEALPLRD